MVDSWPDTLPQRFMLDGGSETSPNNLVEAQPDTGPPMTRRRSTAAAGMLTGSMLMTTAQTLTLDTFLKTTLAMGALPFNFPAQRGAGTLLVKFVAATLPTYAKVAGGYHTATFALYIMP